MPRLKSLAAQAANPSNPEPQVPVANTPTTDAAAGALATYEVARPIDVPAPGGNSVNYLQVFHPVCGKAQAIMKAIPDVQECDVIAMPASGSIVPVSKLHFVHGAQFYVEMSPDDGKILAVSKSRPAEWNSPLVEHVESLVLAYIPGRIITAKAVWRRTRSVLAKVMAAELCRREGRWPDFTGTPRKESRTNKSKGNTYTILTADIAPINADEIRLLAAWMEDVGAQDEFRKVKAAYEQRLAWLDSMAQ